MGRSLGLLRLPHRVAKLSTICHTPCPSGRGFYHKVGVSPSLGKDLQRATFSVFIYTSAGPTWIADKAYAAMDDDLRGLIRGRSLYERLITA